MESALRLLNTVIDLDLPCQEDNQGQLRQLRDWSLITGRGASEVLPLRKGRGGGGGSHAKGGGAQRVLGFHFYVVA